MAEQDTTSEEALRLAILARPEQVPERAALASRLNRSGRRSDALAVLRDGLFFAAGREDRLEQLADAFMAADSWPDALEALQTAARLAPRDGRLPGRLAELWVQLGDMEKAEAAAARARSLGVDVTLDLQAHDTASTRQLFNQYAKSFDHHLLDTLHYAIPAALLRALTPRLRQWEGGTAIDLGCGTGLMGAVLRGHVNRLVGVDISAGMLEQARGKNLYDQIVEADVVDYLRETAERPTLLVAADVLVYIGSIAPLFDAAARCLGAGGLFAFSVERAGDGDYAQARSRRFAHSETYIRHIAAECALDVLELAANVPRFDRGVPVDGLLVVLGKPTGSPTS